jgi:hypothetical protein
MPENRLPAEYGIADQASFPSGIVRQWVYPFR